MQYFKQEFTNGDLAFSEVGAEFTDCIFKNCMVNVSLEGATFTDCEFIGCAFTGKIAHSTMYNCSFDNCAFKKLKTDLYVQNTFVNNCKLISTTVNLADIEEVLKTNKGVARAVLAFPFNTFNNIVFNNKTLSYESIEVKDLKTQLVVIFTFKGGKQIPLHLNEDKRLQVSLNSDGRIASLTVHE